MPSCLILALAAGALSAQTIDPAVIQPQDRIVAPISSAERVSVPNSVHPAVLSALSSQSLDPAFALDHMILALQPSPGQQAALTELLVQQQDTYSPNFHKFLTPAQYAASFGVSQSDLSKITAWLTASGFRIDEVVANNMAIVFSGHAAQVEAAFKTEIRQYQVNGETHFANATAPQIPAALSAVVQGFVKLNDFHSKPASAGAKLVPQYTAGSGAHYLVPADYAVIYNLNPLFTSGFSGAAQSIAVVARSNINPTDLAGFRAAYGLPTNTLTTFFAGGTDPGITADSNTLEATLDLEWADAVAPNANLKFVIAASTSTTDGIDLASQYAVTHNIAPILSVSYGACEASVNSTFYNTLWKQAAAQGMSVFVAAGDSGAAGCDSPAASSGTVKGVNALCSTPYNTCVGGTMFADTANPGLYWQPGNNAVMGSAISYIPEQAWNESALISGGNGLLAGGGGVSAFYSKPYWQSGNGVPADGHRDIPDVSLTSAQHDGYMIYYTGAAQTVAGTSAATPAFAGIMALVNQKVGSSQGNINQVLYPLAAIGTPAGTLPIFHDIVSGNNSVPGVTGYSAGTGYDLATGLGSVDATQLANNWTSVTGGFTLTASAISINLTPAAPSPITLTLTDVGTFNSVVNLTISNLPTGVTASFAPGSFAGTGSSVLTFSAAGTAITGTYPITVTAKGGNYTRTVSFSLAIIVSTGCTLTATPTSLTVVQSQATSTKLACGHAQGVFSSSLTLSVTGVPSGVTAAFSPSTSLNAGTGVDTLTVNATTAAIPGTYTMVVTATLPNSTPAFSSTFSVPLTINAPSTFTVTPSVTTVSIPQGASATVTLTSLHTGSFNSPLTFQTSGLPSAITAALSAASVAAPGDGSLTITLSTLSIATAGNYTVTVLVQGGGLVLRVPIAVQITTAPAYSMTASLAVMTLRQSYVSPSNVSIPGTGAVNLTIANLTNGFNLPVGLTVGTLPTGVTAAFSSATLAAPGTGVSILTLSATATAATGVSFFTVTAVGGTITRTVKIELILTPPPSFTLNVNYPSYNLPAGASMTETAYATGLYGYNSNIQLSVTAPTGISAGYSTTTISGANGTAHLTIQAVSTVVAGTYTITLTGTDLVTGNVQTTQITLVVGTVTTVLNASTLSMAPSTVASATITVTATSYTGHIVVLTITGMPYGVSYSLSPTSLGGSGVSTLTLNAGPYARAGTYTVTVTTSYGGISSSTPLFLTIT